MTSEAGAEEAIALTDVMLAMDVVDTLRHQDSLVERALNAEERERALIERVRKTYASQGIDVTDEVITAGVKALNRTGVRLHAGSARPQNEIADLLGPSPQCCARRFDRRGASGKSSAEAGTDSSSCRRHRHLVESVEQLNAQILNAGVDVKTLDQRRLQLGRALKTASSGDVPTTVQAGFERESVAADNHLKAAARQLERASELAQSPTAYSVDNYARLGGAVERQLGQQSAALAGVTSALDSAESAIGRLERMRGLPAELKLLRDEAMGLAVEAKVDQRISGDYDNALVSLRQGDVASAESAADAMKAAIATLSTEYTLSIVSRPGEMSGVIREPPNNRSASNYYVVVEALDRSGSPVNVSVQSEEDGRTRTVNRWGIRVEESLFNRVRADKQDDGIIQNRIVGAKERGFLKPRYQVPTSGAAITSW